MEVSASFCVLLGQYSYLIRKSKTALKILYSIDYQLNAYFTSKNTQINFAMWKIIANIVKSISNVDANKK